ncbi:MAG TPA: HAMP domain-containing sensor histidine kinase [Pirellulaceae bacterium]|jgi:signal transduction histidine kinase|nr:HAMP domain-containing sensor histidine kinase [Pirellulaceae bacterium]
MTPPASDTALVDDAIASPSDFEPENSSAETEAADLSWNELLQVWESSVARLQATQTALKEEVRRLREELAEKRRDLERKRQLAELGQMACHIAHEVRNGLVPTTLYSGLLERRLANDPESLALLAKLTGGMKQVDGIVRDLLAWSRELEIRPRRTNVRRWLEETLEPLATQFAAHGIDADLSQADDCEASFDADLLRRAVVNLALNSVDALSHGGTIGWTLRRDEDALLLEIRDDGPGVPLEQRDRLFQPFFTTRSHGTGLGLALVRKIAEAHGGEASYREAPGGGAIFSIRISTFDEAGT